MQYNFSELRITIIYAYYVYIRFDRQYFLLLHVQYNGGARMPFYSEKRK